MAFVMTLTQRLAGNIYTNQYYLAGADVAAAITEAQAVFQAQRAIQTTDVEYVSMNVTDLSSPFATTPIQIATTDQYGQIGGTATGPAITFLEFTFYPSNARGKTTHRIRGYESNDITDLGVFALGSRGIGDSDAGSPVPTGDTLLLAYALTVAASTVDRNQRPLNASERVSIGSRRATRRL